MNKRLQVTHIIGDSFAGGAGKGALNLHVGLLEKGVDSRIVSVYENSKSDFPHAGKVLTAGVFGRVRRFIRNRVDQFVSRGVLKSDRLFSGNFIGVDLCSRSYIKESDIIHLHWISSAAVSLKEIDRLRQPIVWTLRDMWPLTGGCHYTLGCERFTLGCGSCPILKKGPFSWDRSSEILRRKQLLSLKIVPVAISPWLAKEAERSDVWGKNSIRSIWNGINLSEFPAQERQRACVQLGLDPQEKYLLTGAIDINDVYKGGDLLCRELGHFFSDAKNSNVTLLSFGKGGHALSELTDRFHDFGYVKETEKLNLIYSAADVFLASSRQEAFGKTIAEALSSGTPVVSFRGSAPENMIDHKKSGYLADLEKPSSFSQGVSFVLEKLRKPAVSVVCAKRAQEFCHLKLAAEYLDLYKSILRNRTN